MPDITWTSLLATSTIAAIVGGLIGGFVTLRVAQNQYLNDYYKTIVSRRIAAYEHLEHLIIMLKTSISDESDEGIYHLLFSFDDKTEMFKSLFNLSAQAMWLSNEIVAETIALSRFFYSFPSDKAEIIEHAKNNYHVIAETRTRLELLCARDFLTLHDVPGFFKSKKPIDSYDQLPRRV